MAVKRPLDTRVSGSRLPHTSASEKKKIRSKARLRLEPLEEQKCYKSVSVPFWWGTQTLLGSVCGIVVFPRLPDGFLRLRGHPQIRYPTMKLVVGSTDRWAAPGLQLGLQTSLLQKTLHPDGWDANG